MRKLLLAVLLGLGACTGGPLPPSAVLPPGTVSGATDPLRHAVLVSAHAFNTPGALEGPAKAQGVMLVEYLAANQAWDLRWSEFAGPVGPALLAARGELREALAIPADASPQLVVIGMSFAQRRLSGEVDVPPLPAEAFPEAEATLQRLAALPPLPLTRGATAMAERQLLRIDQERLYQSTGPDGAGGRP